MEELKYFIDQTKFEIQPKKNYIHVLEKALAKILKVKFVIFTTSGSSALTLAFFCSEINKKKSCNS